MDIYIDPHTSPPSLSIKGSVGDSSLYPIQLSQPYPLKLKRGDQLPLKVHIVGSKTATSLRLGVKARKDYNSPLLLLATAQPEVNTDGSIVFNLILNVNSRELNTAFGTDTRATGLSSIAAEAEFTWIDGAETRISDSLLTLITNDIIKGIDADVPSLPQTATIDLDYDATSSNAQSGLAVAEALELSPKAYMPVVELGETAALELAAGVMYRYTLAAAVDSIGWQGLSMESHADKVMTCELCIDAREYAAHEVMWPASWIWIDEQTAPDLSTGGLRYFAIRSDHGLTFIVEHSYYSAASA